MQPSPSLPERRREPLVPKTVEIATEDESPLAADERAYEELEAQEQKEAFLEHAETVPTSQVTTPSGTQPDDSATAAPPVSKDEVIVQLEKILEEGLGEYVAAMPEEARVRFLYKGQETASKIGVMVRSLKVQAKKVVELVRDWLLTIPGVNKFFLEQEAKIKTDQILQLEKDYRDRESNRSL